MLNTKNLKIVRIAAMVTVCAAAFAGITAQASEITSEKIIELTNESRAEAGLKPLHANEKLTLAAEKKADDMFAQQYFDHISPDGTTPWQWFEAVNYDYSYAAENLAMDFTSAERAHSALMKSTGHRENILGANYKEIGVAAVRGNFNGRTTIIIVEEFGTSRKEMQSQITSPFFEESAPSEPVAPAKIPVNPIVKIQKPASEIENKEITKKEGPVLCDCKPEKLPNKQCGCEQNSKGSKEASKNIDLKQLSPAYGKIAPEIYSIKDYRTLKKVYMEDIYWENAQPENEDFFLSGKAKLKALLKEWTDGRCCNTNGK